MLETTNHFYKKMQREKTAHSPFSFLFQKRANFWFSSYSTSTNSDLLLNFAFKLYHKTCEQFYRNFGIYEKSPNSFLSGLPHSIVNQFDFHNFLCLCLASVHLPYPFHLVFGFQLFGHAVLLCQWPHDQLHAVSCRFVNLSAILSYVHPAIFPGPLYEYWRAYPLKPLSISTCLWNFAKLMPIMRNLSLLSAAITVKAHCSSSISIANVFCCCAASYVLWRWQ